MASIAAVASFLNSTSNQVGTYVSSSFTPTAGDLIVVISTFAATTDNTVAITESAGGGTYTQVAVKEWSGTSSRQFVHIRDALIPGSPAARTIRADLPADGATACLITVLRVTGMTKVGAAAMRQSAVAKDGSGTTPATTFSAACLTGNPVFVACTDALNPHGLTAPASPFDTIFDARGIGTPTTGMATVKSDSGYTGTTITWGASIAAAWGAIAIELDASSTSTVNGTAALSVPHSLVVNGTRKVYGSAVSTPADLLVVNGIRKVLGTVAKNHAPTLTVAGLRKVLGLADLSQMDFLTAAADRKIVGSSGLSAVDLLVVSGVVTGPGVTTVYGTALLSGVDAMLVAGRRTVLGSSALAGLAGSLLTTGRRTVIGSAALPTTEALTILSVRKVPGVAGLSVVSALTASGEVVHFITVVEGLVSLTAVPMLRVFGEVTAHPPLVVRGTAPNGSKAYSPTQLTRTGFQYPMLSTDGTRVFIVKQYVNQVPYERRAVDIHGTEWRVIDLGLLEPL